MSLHFSTDHRRLDKTLSRARHAAFKVAGRAMREAIEEAFVVK
jgi:hypothetical protein